MCSGPLAARARRLGWLAPGVLVSLLVLGAYLRRLTPGLDYHDFGEMQFTAFELGVPHGGYPLYIWLGHLFQVLVPIGTPAYRLNLMSAVLGAASVFEVYLISVELLGSRFAVWLGSAAAALAFGLSYTPWSIAIFAQMYTLHVALALLVVWLALRFGQDHRERWLAASLFTYGLMFGNHACTLSVGPGLALFVLSVQPRAWLSWRRPLLAGGSFLAGFLIGCVFLLWLLWQRHLPWDYLHSTVLANPDLFPFLGGHDTFWRAWWFGVGSLQYRWAFQPNLEWTYHQLRAFPHRFVGELFPLGALGSVAGFLLLARRQWRANLLLLGIIVTQTALILRYENWKVPFYFAAPYACDAIGLAVALSWLGDRFAGIARVWPLGWPRPARQLGLAAAFAVTLALLATVNVDLAGPYQTWLQVRDPKSAEEIGKSLGERPDGRGNHGAEAEAQLALASIPDGSLVFSEWMNLFALAYVAHIDGLRPGLEIREAYPSPDGGVFSAWKQRFIKEQLGRREVFFYGDSSRARGPYREVQVAAGVTRFE